MSATATRYRQIGRPCPLDPGTGRLLSVFHRHASVAPRDLLSLPRPWLSQEATHPRRHLLRGLSPRLTPDARAGTMTREWLNDRYLFPGVNAMHEAARTVVFGRDGDTWTCLLPHNFGIHDTPLTGASYRARVPFDRAMVAHYARAGGWLAAVAALPGLMRLVLRSTSSRGENSPYTRLGWIGIAFQATAADRADGGMSPGRLWRRVGYIHRRAQALLCPRPGIGDHHRSSKDAALITARWLARWRSVKLAVAGGSCRRAAFIVAAQKRTLHGAWYPGWTADAPDGEFGPDGKPKVTTYRAARAVLALAAAPDTGAVIESALLRPEWRASAYRWLARDLIAALQPLPLAA